MSNKKIGLGESSEDYLETILQLEKKGKVRCVDIATALKVTKPSVNKAMNVLKEQEFVTQEIYGDIKLTEKGRSLAQAILHRHKVLTSFLSDILKVSEENAEADACKIEHIISGETFEKIEAMLDNN